MSPSQTALVPIALAGILEFLPFSLDQKFIILCIMAFLFGVQLVCRAIEEQGANKYNDGVEAAIKMVSEKSGKTIRPDKLIEDLTTLLKDE